MVVKQTNFFTVALIKLYLYFIAFFAIARLSFFIMHTNLDFFKQQYQNIFSSFWMGFRFDSQIILYLLLPFAIYVLAVALYPKPIKLPKPQLVAFIKWFYILMASVASALWIIEMFYYGFFKTRFNILLFGIENDAHVLQSIIKEFPIVLSLIAIIILVVIHAFFITKIFASSSNVFLSKNYVRKVIVVIGFVAVYVFGMRGTVTMFPLHEFNAHFSNNQFANEMCKNPIFCLQAAWHDKQNNAVSLNVSGTLQQFGFSSTQQMWQTFLRDSSIANQPNSPLQLIDTTPYNSFLQTHPPHVIFLQMESMSNTYFDLHSSQCNTMAALASQMPYLTTFRHSTSMRIGTHITLDWLLSKSLMNDLSNSNYYAHPMAANISKVYQQANYNTQFVTGNELGWNNLDRGIVHQHFNQVLGKAELLQNYPNAQMHEYGVHDETMFDYIYQSIATSNKPQFIYGMTISNHSPYQLPSTYSAYPIDVHTFQWPRKTASDDMVKKNLLAYQYANDCLGKFIQKIRNSKFGSNTIIVATGDHNSKAVLDYNGEYLFQFNNVPCIYYIPPAYKPAVIDTSIFTSHADIDASILQLSLSNAAYYKFGHSVFENIADDNQHLAINFDDRWVANKKGFVAFGGKPIYYNWIDKYKTKVSISDTIIPDLQALIPYVNAMFGTSIIHTQYDLMTDTTMFKIKK
jgi:phosphoglycerol transferase MdoB-like AlkP superfamily enzyme